MTCVAFGSGRRWIVAVLLAALGSVAPAGARGVAFAAGAGGTTEAASGRADGVARVRAHAAAAERFGVTVHSPERFRRMAARVEAICRRELPRLAREAGLDSMAPVRIDVVGDVAPYRRRFGASLPVWGAAFAVLEDHAIVIDAMRADRAPGDLDRVVAHELSHLVVARRIGHARVPLWFLEGVARRQAHEASIVDAWQLMVAVQTGRAPALWTLARRFPADADRARDAYRVSGAAVEYLLGHENGALARFLDRLARGESFDRALARTTGSDPAAWMADFHARLERRYRSRLVVFETAPLLGLAAVLFLAAIVRYQVRKRRRIKALDEGDAPVGLDPPESGGV